MIIMDILYIVKFCRKDYLPDEEYAYYDKSDAERHLRFFANDDSGLYRKISLIQSTRYTEKELQVLLF